MGLLPLLPPAIRLRALPIGLLRTKWRACLTSRYNIPMYFRLFLGLATLLMPVALAGDPPKLAPPYATPSASNAPKIIPQPSGVALRVPPGFTVSEFAAGFAKPRYMVEGPKGEVLLSDSVKEGAVYVL